jgi:hypothetical protein
VIVDPPIPAGTMIQMIRGARSDWTTLARSPALVAPSCTWRDVGRAVEHDELVSRRMSRSAMFPPIRPSPIIASAL